MQDKELEALHAAMAALEGQRATLGDAVVEMALAPLRARLAAPPRPAGLQRRQVTVMFADVVGSTAMAQAMDAEETLDVLSGTLQRMAAIVEAHHGRVLRFTGDGLKAVFGMGEVREDDAEHAVRAGLAIVEAGRGQAEEAQRLHGIADFAVRVGVHTGDVALGAGVEADSTAIGAAVHIAARMEQTAPPGTLRISHDTWNQVRGLFAVDAQPPLQVKGVDAPMRTYLVSKVLERSFLGAERGLAGLVTPMVGRQTELQALRDAVARARQTGQVQALTLVAEAGMGKSRLLRELVAGLSDCRLLTVRAQPDGLLRPWGLLRGLLVAQFAVADTDSAEVARRKVVEGLMPCFDERGEQQAQLIGQLAGLDFGASPHVRGLDPRSLRDQALAAFVAYLRALAAQGSALPVLLAEDLHWADDSSLDLLQHLLLHTAGLPLALVMTGRPALLARRPNWDAAASLVQLGPLPATHSDELAQALLQRLDAVPPRLSELLVGQAEGNPYYMEELVRRLIDEGVIDATGPRWTVQAERLEAVRLPGTLVGLLQARLDALPAGERQAVRQASVIGHVFWDDALQALDASAPQALPALQRAAFVKAHDRSDFEGTVERQFDHHLLHQVTYETLLKAERKMGHGAAARWLRERTQGRSAEFLAMTGEHAERAGETALAVDCFEQAGKDASKRFANAAAQSWLRRALALLGGAEPGRRFSLLIDLGKVADVVGDQATLEAGHAEMTALLERHPDDTRLAELLFSKALRADRRSDAAASERLARQAFEVAERCGAARWAAMAHGQLAWLHIAGNQYEAADRHVERGLVWARKIGAEFTKAETEAQLLTLSAMSSLQRGRMGEAGRTLEAVLLRGQTLGTPRLMLGALDNLALAAAYLGKWDESAAWGERMRALGREIGARHDVAAGELRLAAAAAATGDAAAAIRLYAQLVEQFRALGDRRMVVFMLRHLGAVQLQQGDAAAALASCLEASSLHPSLSEALETCEVAALAAHCELQLGRPAAALAAVNTLLHRLESEFATHPADATIGIRWICSRVLDALGDERAAPLLTQLFADVHARAAQLTEADDCERLIQAIPTFFDIAAAHAGRDAQGSAR